MLSFSISYWYLIKFPYFGGGDDNHKDAGLELCILRLGTTEEQEAIAYNGVEPLSMLEIWAKAARTLTLAVWI
jgi:hypothetical protein